MPPFSTFSSLVWIAAVAVSLSPILQAAPPQALDQALQTYSKQFGLPAISAAVFQNGAIIAAGKAGTRRGGQNIPVTIDDRFHIGSDSKAFTALLASQFVQASSLLWTSTFADVFPELKSQMNAEFAKITLEQLLSHSSGLTDMPAIVDLSNRSYQQDGNMDEVRYWMLKQVASKALAHPRGSKFDYSNLGYTFAGAMLERVGKKTWEELIEERIIKPMDLKTAGFGPQSSLGKADAPLGHVLINGKPKAMLAGPNGDNPLIIGPDGTMHMSVLDFAKWVAWNSGEGKRPPALVSPATVKKLHTAMISTGERKDAPPGTPKSGEYALGWLAVTQPWANAPCLTHDGSNTMNLARAAFWPSKDFGFVIMTNIGGQSADAAFNQLSPELYKRFAGTMSEGRR